VNRVGWARQHEHDADPRVRAEARQVLRNHYLPTGFVVVVFMVIPVIGRQVAA
jgi:hypothetical protein